jgi:hypothetical protein
MTGTFPEGDPFEKLHGIDGYHATKLTTGPLITVCATLYAQGKPVAMGGDPDDPIVVLKEWYPVVQGSEGEAIRLQLVMDATARYLSTGGNWEELLAAQALFQQFALGGMVFKGYHLVDSYLTTENVFQHVFATDNEDGNAVLWQECDYNEAASPFGGWIDYTTLEALAAQTGDDTDDDTDTDAAGPADNTLPVQHRESLALPDSDS